MSARVTRPRKVHREVGYSYVEENLSSSSSSYEDSNDYDDDDGLSRSNSFDDDSDDYDTESSSSSSIEDGDANKPPVRRKLDFDACEDVIDFLLGSDDTEVEVVERPLKKAKKDHTDVDVPTTTTTLINKK